MPMKYTPIGRTGAHASLLALGAMTFGEKNTWKLGGLGRDAVDKMVARAIDSGINLFDTADVYGKGVSEEICGQAAYGLMKSFVTGETPPQSLMPASRSCS